MSAKGERVERVAGGVDARHRARRASSGPKISSRSTARVRRQAGDQRGRAEPALVRAPASPRGHHRALATRPAPRSAPPAPAPRVDHRRHLGGEVVRPAPPRSTVHGAGQPLDQRVRDRLVHQHARGRRALLAGVAEGRVRRSRARPRRGRRPSRRSRSSCRPSPPPRASRAAARPGVSAAARTISRPTALEPVKAITCTRGSRTSAAPTSPNPGSSEMAPGGHAGLVQRLAPARQRRRRRLLGRLQHHRVARGQRRPRSSRRGSPAGSSRARSRRPRRAARSASRCARPAPGAARAPASSAQRLARVVLEEVDRLAHVGVGLGPRLRALAHLERRQLEAALAQDAAAARTSSSARRSAAGRRRQSRKPRSAASTAAPASASLARPARATSARGRARVGRVEALGGAALAADQDRHRQRQPRRRARRSASSSDSRAGARRSSSVGSLANGSRRAPAAPRAARRAPARAGTTRWRCSRAAGARGRPCRPPGRRPGSRRARGGPRAASAWPSSSPRPRSTWSSRSRSSPPATRLQAIACATERRLCEAIAGPHGRPRLQQAAGELLEVAVAVRLLPRTPAAASRAGAPPRSRGPSRRPSRAAPRAAGGAGVRGAPSRGRDRAAAGDSRR